MLNCRKGDLARIVDHKETRALGVVDAFVKIGAPGHVRSGRAAWQLDPPLQLKHGMMAGHPLEVIADALVRPLRDNPGEDEMLRIAGKPGEIRHLTEQQWAAIEARWAV